MGDPNTDTRRSDVMKLFVTSLADATAVTRAWKVRKQNGHAQPRGPMKGIWPNLLTITVSDLGQCYVSYPLLDNLYSIGS